MYILLKIGKTELTLKCSQLLLWITYLNRSSVNKYIQCWRADFICLHHELNGSRKLNFILKRNVQVNVLAHPCYSSQAQKKHIAPQHDPQNLEKTYKTYIRWERFKTERIERERERYKVFLSNTSLYPKHSCCLFSCGLHYEVPGIHCFIANW